MKKIIIAVIILMLVCLVGCDNNNLPNKDYKDFNHLDHWDYFDDIEEKTIIFYYSPFCEICKSIEGKVTGYLVILEQDHPVYLVHEGMIYEQGTPPYDVIEVPSILVYENNQFEKISGSKPLLKFLAELTKNK